jgi:hypothetical protein
MGSRRMKMSREKFIDFLRRGGTETEKKKGKDVEK